MKNQTKLLSDIKLAQIRTAQKSAVIKLHVQALNRRLAYNISPNHCLACHSPILSPLNASGSVFQQIREKHFCNRSCAAKYNMGLAASPRHLPKIRICPICGKNYTRPQSGSFNRYSTCLGVALTSLPTKTKSECRLQVIRAHARGIIRRLGKKSCQVCGYTHRVDCCHIKPIKKFLPTALVSEINAIGNLSALCPNHHIELDLGILKMVGATGFEPATSPPQTERSSQAELSTD